MAPKRLWEREQNIEKAVERGWQYFKSEYPEGYFPSYTSTSREIAEPRISPREIFSTVIITDTILKYQPNNKVTRAALHYIENQRQQGKFTFFEDKSIYPPDTDTNALGYSVLLESGRPLQEEAHRILDTILAHKDGNSLVQVWLSKDRQNRIDPIVSASALYLAYLLGRGPEVTQTEQWLTETLNLDTCLTGSRYYQSPDSFLHFIGRLAKFPELADKMKPKLIKHLQRRIGKTEYPLDLAMRAALADSLGINNQEEKQKLLKLQERSGSWPADALFRYGNQQYYFGSKPLTTAFSMKGLKKVGF